MLRNVSKPFIFALCAGSILLAAAVGLWLLSRKSFDGKLLASIPRDFEPTTYFSFSPEGKLMGEGKKWFITFSRDGTQVAYTASQNGKNFVVVGSQRGPMFFLVRPPIFGPDSKKIVYTACLEGEPNQLNFKPLYWMLVLNNDIYPPMNLVEWPVFSPDGSTLAFVAKQSAYWHTLVVGNHRVGDFEKIKGPPVFSPDGSMIACVVNRDGRWRVLFGSRRDDPGFRELPQSAQVASSALAMPDFLPLEKHALGDGSAFKWFFAEAMSGHSLHILDPLIEEIASPVFSSDSERFGWAVKRSGKWHFPASDQRLQFDQIRGPLFSPDGSKIAYVTRQGDNESVVVEDKIGPQFDEVSAPIFSPDGTKVAYGARRGGKWFVVIGSHTGPEFASLGKPMFSPDGNTVAYAASYGEGAFMVVGEKNSPKLDEVMPLQFSTDSKKFFYGARKNRDLWWITMDLQ